jgi:hypothetical protein
MLKGLKGVPDHRSTVSSIQRRRNSTARRKNLAIRAADKNFGFGGSLCC